MYHVYLLQSLKDSQLYTGFTSNLEKRFQEHNNGQVISTKMRRPFKLIYSESYLNEKDARLREKNLKLRSRALVQLKNRIKASLLQ